MAQYLKVAAIVIVTMAIVSRIAPLRAVVLAA
jgi:hypothetical protein